jgi:hypothetical protein
MNEYQGTFFKTEAERAEVENDEFFIGCYIASSWPTKIWKDNEGTGSIFFFPFPYFHFNAIWGNFVGYTSMPDRQFGSEESSLSTEELALKALPNPPNPDYGGDAEFAPQQSTFILDSFYDYYQQRKNPCPLPNMTGDFDFCPYLNNCGYAQDPGAITGSPSTNDMYGFLVAISVIYLLLAAYWAIVFPGSNGRSEKFYFFLIPSYWFGSKQKAIDGPESRAGQAKGVTIDGVKKSFGEFEALKGVSFNMNQGEVTALLGKLVVDTK